MRTLLLVGLVVMCAGCPTRAARVTTLAPPVGVVPAALDRYEAARGRLDRGELAEAERAFTAVAEEWPHDPIAAHALYHAGVAASRAGGDDRAVRVLRLALGAPGAVGDLRQRGELALGLALGALGEYAESRALLEPLVTSTTGDEATHVQAVLAAADTAVGELAHALGHYDAFFANAGVAERRHIADRVAAIVDLLPAAELEPAYARAKPSAAAAVFLARRLATQARARGDDPLARRLLFETAVGRVAVGLDPAEGAADSVVADRNRVGALLPLTGKQRLVGEAALAGLLHATGADGDVPGAGVVAAGRPLGFTVLVRDTGAGPEQAAAAVDALYAAGAIAAIGPADKDTTVAAARRAEALALPLVTLNVIASAGAASTGSPHLFGVVLYPEDRARVLARRAFRAGARAFAVLAPDGAYGVQVAAAFREEVLLLGARVVAEASYDRRATSFVEPIAKLARGSFDALFVPDLAQRLELVVAQLAAADLIAAPPRARAPKRGRAFLLLSTAEGLAPGFLAGAGRYARGALFAPGFYVDHEDPRIGPWAARFLGLHGRAPVLLNAQAWDAALVVRAAVEAGAATRDAVAETMARQMVPALTGDIRFGPSRQRIDEGVLFEVREGAGGVLAIRALREPAR